MFTVILGVICQLVFAAGAATLGAWLRGHPSKTNAAKTSRVMHFLYFTSWGLPTAVAVFYPGLTHFDEALGMSPLPARGLFLAIGILLALPGLYLLAITNKALRAIGSGANAFRLTKNVVAQDIYSRTRNPMSLGFYLVTLASALLLGSTVLTAGILLCLIPAHLFFLWYFEEKELELRFGESYLEYRKKVPFLIPRLQA